jgi:protein-tyrosine kinase
VSNLLKALKRGQGEVSELVLESAAVTPIEEALEEASLQPADLLLPVEPIAPVALTEATHEPPLTPDILVERVPTIEAEVAGGEKPGIRTLALRLSASTPLLPFDTQQHVQANEQYRIIRTKILQHAKQPHMIVISSAGSADGKTVTAVNIAGALSLKPEVNTLIIDADFRRPVIAKLLGLPESPGITEVLSGAAALEEALVRAEQLPNLYVLPSGGRSRNPVELLDSQKWALLVQRLRESFSYIILDSPPIAAVADYDLLQAVCDGVVVVVRPDHSRRASCFKALGSVPKDKLIGVVVNCFPKWALAKDDQYGGYSYASEIPQKS